MRTSEEKVLPTGFFLQGINQALLVDESKFWLGLVYEYTSAFSILLKDTNWTT